MTRFAALVLVACCSLTQAALVLPSSDARIAAGLFDPQRNETLWGTNAAGGSSVIRVGTAPFAKTDTLVLGNLLSGNLSCATADLPRRRAYFINNANGTMIARVNLDTFQLDGNWSLGSRFTISLWSHACFVDTARNLMYISTRGQLGIGRLVRLNMLSWGRELGNQVEGFYEPSSIPYIPPAVACTPTSMVLNRNIVYSGVDVSPGRVVGVAISSPSVAVVVTIVLDTGECSSTTCNSPRGGVFDISTNSSYWAVTGQSGPAVVRIIHNDRLFSFRRLASDHMSLQPSIGVLAASWVFFVASNGTSPVVLRAALPELTSPSYVTLQYGTGGVGAAVVDFTSNSSAERGWLYAGYLANDATSPGMIANVAVWELGVADSTMSESIAPTPSATMSASTTASTSITPTQTGSCTATVTDSSTASRSGSSSVSTTPSATVTASASATLSSSPTTTRSSTETTSSSLTTTGSLSGSTTGTSSTSRSQTVSPSSTATITDSRSPGSTPSSTASRSATASGATRTASATRSITQSETSSRSAAKTPTKTASATVSASVSRIPSTTPTGTRSSSGSRSSTGTAVSPTSSISAGASPSGTSTPSWTASSSSSASQTASVSVSSTSSGTPTRLPVAVLTLSAARWDGTGPLLRSTPSGRPTPSLSRSSSISITSTSTKSSGASTSATAMAVGSPTTVPLVTRNSNMNTSAATAQFSIAQPSVAPVSARDRALSDSSGLEHPLLLTLMVSEAWVPTSFYVSASEAPGDGENVTVRCDSGNAALGLVITPVDGYTLTGTYAAAASPVHLNFSIIAPFTTNPIQVEVDPDSHSDITCYSISMSDSDALTRRHFASTGPVQLRASVLRARWPLVQDVIIHKAKNGEAKSAFGGYVDIWEHLFVGCKNNTDECPDSDKELALGYPDAVAYALRSSGVLNLTREIVLTQPFEIQLSGTTHATFVADETWWYGAGAKAHFHDPAAISVTIGDAACRVLWVSSDGRLLHVITPAYLSVCPDSDEDCGFKPFSITAGPSTFGVRDPASSLSSFAGVWAEANNSGNEVQPPPLSSTGRISCPPFCPTHYSSPGIVPIVVYSSGGREFSAVPGRVNSSTGERVQVVSHFHHNGTQRPRGIFFSQTCVGNYINDTALCSDWGNPFPARCPFGAGDDCQNCPEGAICPGGYTVLVRRGFYVSAVNRLPVIKCAPPAEERCLGWNASANRVQCGEGYRPGSYRCQSCEEGFFAAADGSCDRCPNPNIGYLLQTLFVFLASLAAFGAVNLCFILAVAKYSGGSVSGSASAALQLIIWTFTVIQTIVQVGKGASPGLPSLLRRAYTGLDVFSFGGLAPNTACLAGAYAFLNEATQMGLALGLLLLLSVLQFSGSQSLCLRQRAGGATGAAARCTLVDVSFEYLPVLLNCLYTTLTLIYPIVMLAAADMLSCIPALLPVRLYLTMDQDGTSLGSIGRALPVNVATGALMSIEELLRLSDSGDRAVSKLLNAMLSVNTLASNSLYVCREGAHAPMWSLAWATLILYGIGYPLATFLFLWRRLNNLLDRQRTEAAAASLRDYTEGQGFCTPGRAWLSCLFGIQQDSSQQPASSARQLAVGDDDSSLHLPTTADATPTRRPSLAFFSTSRTTVSDNGGERFVPQFRTLIVNPMAVRVSDCADSTPARSPVAAAVSPATPSATTTASGAKQRPRPVATEPHPPSAISRVLAPCPLSHCLGEAGTLARPLDPVSSFLDSHPELLGNTTLSHFTGAAADYRPSAFFFRHLDLGLLFVLSCLLQFWRRPSSNPEIYAKMAVSYVVLGGLALAVVLMRPFRPDEMWKHWVRVYSLFLCMVAATLNGFMSLTGFADGWQVVLSTGITAFSFIVFIMSIGLFVMLLAGFWFSLVTKGRQEAARQQAVVVAAEPASALAAYRSVGGVGTKRAGALARSDEAFRCDEPAATAQGAAQKDDVESPAREGAGTTDSDEAGTRGGQAAEPTAVGAAASPSKSTVAAGSPSDRVLGHDAELPGETLAPQVAVPRDRFSAGPLRTLLPSSARALFGWR